MKTKLLFVVSQFYKGGAEVTLLNLLKKLDREKYEIDFIIMNQCPAENAVSLIPVLPTDIHVLDAWKAEQRLSLVDRCKRKLLCAYEDLRQYPSSAVTAGTTGLSTSENGGHRDL